VTFLRDTGLLAARSLRAIPRVPERLLDVTIQPIVFILLFLYVFGSAIHVPGISYKDYMFPGIIGQSLAFGVIGAGVATSHDMTEGVIDRFRSMPISRLSIISGQVAGQFCEQVLGLAIVLVFGVILGWHPHLTLAHLFELGGLTVLAMLAFTWMGVLFGMLVRSPDAMQGVGFIVILPLAFLAGTFDRRHGRGAAGDRPVGSDLRPGRHRARVDRGRARHRLVAARASRDRHGDLVTRDHRGVHAARASAVQPDAGGLTVTRLRRAAAPAPRRRRARATP
jgi:hypothetical protein